MSAHEEESRNAWINASMECAREMGKLSEALNKRDFPIDTEKLCHAVALHIKQRVKEETATLQTALLARDEEIAIARDEAKRVTQDRARAVDLLVKAEAEIVRLKIQLAEATRVSTKWEALADSGHGAVDGLILRLREQAARATTAEAALARARKIAANWRYEAENAHNVACGHSPILLGTANELVAALGQPEDKP